MLSRKSVSFTMGKKELIFFILVGLGGDVHGDET